ncbi:hypothetical protein [Aureispira anguillae]|uniref:Transposase/invertase (TIGR01784 family) n=1 Tax=Aureispira anguillae TaxID=2864201 RepID=A0A915YJZ8_9BACT|nr:hypothetical protein [Aureispira anguillae]BDS14627.1 hypothetical protein AsAng_0054080 [Aureispira anguillae]
MTLKDKYIPQFSDFGFNKFLDDDELVELSPKERYQYQESLKHYRDLKNVIDSSKDEGIEQGIERGIKQGEKSKAIQIAKTLKNKGISIPLISQSTGLSEQEIEEL